MNCVWRAVTLASIVVAERETLALMGRTACIVAVLEGGYGLLAGPIDPADVSPVQTW